MKRLLTHVVLDERASFLVQTWEEPIGWKGAWRSPLGAWSVLAGHVGYRALASELATAMGHNVLRVKLAESPVARRLSFRWAARYSTMLKARADFDGATPGSMSQLAYERVLGEAELKVAEVAEALANEALPDHS